MTHLVTVACVTSLLFGVAFAVDTRTALSGQDKPLFSLAQENKNILRVSTVIMAQDISRLLGDDSQIDTAIDWCKDTGVTRIFLESFRSGRMADRALLVKARDRFEAAGIKASGCVTTLKMNPQPNAEKSTDCYADPVTQQKLREIFEFTASIFDEIIIDDFFFTTCKCEQCMRDGGEGNWSEYRRKTMLDVSKRCVLEPARAVNPNVRIIIKYPNWFDDIQDFGYDTVAQTKLFDGIWAGTETREPDNPRWGAVQQYRAFFVMRWITELGKDKTGGGWFDEIDTGPDAYIEQARQTVLGGAREMMLFNFAALNQPQRAPHIQRLRSELPELFRLANLIHNLPARGISAVKPPNSAPRPEYSVYEFLGMLGLPIVPVTQVPQAHNTKAAFLPLQAAADEKLLPRLTNMANTNTAVLITDGLAAKVIIENLDAWPSVNVLEVAGDPYNLLKLSDQRVAELRRTMLSPLGIELQAPQRVALYLFANQYAALENFNDTPAAIKLTIADANSIASALVLSNGQNVNIKSSGDTASITLPPRSLILLKLKIESKPLKTLGVFLSDQRLATLKDRIQQQVEPTWSAWLKLKNQADSALDSEPHAMTDWYVPGYYRDAEGHKKAKNGLRDDANLSYTLALAWRMTGEDRYAKAATHLIDAWPATIKSMSVKDDSRLSFSYHFPAMIFAADLLDDCKLWPEDKRETFKTFVREKALPMNTMEIWNNWGNWGLVMASAGASYLGDQELFDMCAKRWKVLLATQIAPDGHLPHEVTRNEGRHGIWYSHFCLMPQTLAAEILRLGGVDLYDYHTPDTGLTLRMAYEKLIPWVLDPETFHYYKGDAKDIVAVSYHSYFELLNTRWPNNDAATLLEKRRPMTASHSAPHLTFTHGDLKNDK